MRTIAASVRGVDRASTLERAAAALDCGFEKLTLEEPLYSGAWEGLRAMLPRDQVSSLRLFLPYPRWLRPGAGSPYRLGLTDADDRREVLKQAAESLRAADRLSIPLVLLPVAEMEEMDATLEGRDGERRACPAFRRVFDSYRSTVYRLLDLADRHELTLCITPSDRADEVPSIEEAAACLREFSGAPVGMWLDALRMPEIAGVESGLADGRRRAGEPASSLQGLSLSDVRDGEEGHLPGTGELRWEAIETRARACPVWVLDLRPGSPLEELARGREVLQQYEAGPSPPPASLFPH